MSQLRPLAPKPTVPALIHPSISVAKQRRHHHTEADWETQKRVVEQLYIIEGRSAEVVIGILERDFGFKTCRRRLFQKLETWGMRKTSIRCDKTAKRCDENLNEIAIKKRRRDSEGEKYTATPAAEGGNITPFAKRQTTNISEIRDLLEYPHFSQSDSISDSDRDAATSTECTPQTLDGGICKFSPNDPGYGSPSCSKKRDDIRESESSSRISTCAGREFCLRRLPKTFRLEEIRSESVLNRENGKSLLLDEPDRSFSQYSHILKDRSTLPEEYKLCTCDQDQEQKPPSTVFEVSVSPQRLKITVFSHELYSDLKSLMPAGFRELDDRGFDGKVLLKDYTTLKMHLDALRSPDYASTPTQDRVDKWKLLVERFLSNRSAFHCFGLQELHASKLLDNRLRDIFSRQELEYGADWLIVLYSLLGFANTLSKTMLDCRNPWFTDMYQTVMDCNSYDNRETINPSLLSRPSTPFDCWQPSLSSHPSPMAVSGEVFNEPFLF